MPSARSKIKDFLNRTSSREREATSSTQPKNDRTPSKIIGVNATSRSSSTSTESTSSSSDGDDEGSEEHILKELKALNIRNFNTLKDVALSGMSGEPINDRTNLMERVIQLAAELPIGTRSSESLTKAFLTQLWDDLQHPPKSYLGDNFVYRKADGSNNNILWPHIGAAGQPYARSVRPKRMQPIAQPDPGLIFDSLLAREKFVPHPCKISSALFYLASIIIHDIFHTSHTDFAISETSSYLDLAPLYGSNEQQQTLVRTRKDGRLKPDCFSDKRILGFPPGVGVLLIMFNRFHNNVVENLARIDEHGRFSGILHPIGRPVPSDAEALYDEALFQTAKLVTTGLYVNIILKDYVRTILNLNRVNSLWNLDPRSELGKALIQKKIPEALGNQVSAEFNLVYRWHSVISERDEQWTEAAYKRIIGSDPNSKPGDVLRGLQQWASSLPKDPFERPFDDLKRTSDGKFADNDLAAIWTASVDDVAGAYGAQHIPKILRDVEILGIIQSRSWNLGSLNELREYFKLSPYKSFEEMNPNLAVAEQLRNLYGHIDNVEIYPGVAVEAAKPPMKPGSGLCTNYTISRAILSDAVALVRSDRYYTVDYIPQNLTNWGFQQADYDLKINYGCVMHKLVLNALPNNYRANSIYAHYPFVIPSENEKIYEELKQDFLYDFSVPTSVPPPVSIHSIRVAEAALTDPNLFTTLWRSNVGLLKGQPLKTSHQLSLAQAILDEPDWKITAKEFYAEALPALLREKQYRVHVFNQVDIIHDILRTAHLGFAAVMLPLPGKLHEKDHHQEDFSQLLNMVFLSAYGPTPYLQSSRRLRKDVNELADNIKEEIESVESTGLFASVMNFISLKSKSQENLSKVGRNALQKVLKSRANAEDITWDQALPLTAAMLTVLTRLSAQGMDNVLDQDFTQLKQDLSATSTLESVVSKITRSSSFLSIACVAKTATTVEDKGTTSNLSPGQTVICHLVSKEHDLRNFPYLPLRLNEQRDAKNDTSISDSTAEEVDEPSTKGLGPDFHLIFEVHKIAMAEILKLVAGMKDLTRTPGPQGHIRGIRDAYGSVMYLNKAENEYLVSPPSLKVCWKP